MRVLVAMSGGVDSSVAAALMVEAGHDVIGVTLKLWEGPNGEAPTAGCCTVSDAEDARRVAAQLDIPYYVLNYTSAFRSAVIDHFVDDYLHGWTPNPCVECNRTVKFDHLLAQAEEFGCERVVTGHYARIRNGSEYRLLRGVDAAKDQSYVLYMLGQEELARVGFPIGEQTKAETRAMARRLGLRTAAKADSQDICFVGQGNYLDFVRSQTDAAFRPGAVVDRDGTELAHHDGIAGFTVGQRKGLGVAVGEPRYVIRVEPSTSTVVVGRKEDLLTSSSVLSDVSFVSGRPPKKPERVLFQYRAHGEAVPGVLERARSGSWLVSFDEPQAAIAPGQAGVFYRGSRLIGGGTIMQGT